MGSVLQLRNPNTLFCVVSFIIFLANAHFLIWMRLSEECHGCVESNSTFNSTPPKLNTSISYYCGPSRIEQPIYYRYTMDYQVI